MGRSLAAILLATLALPFGLAAYLSEDAFLERAVVEHAINTDYWGKERAESIHAAAIWLFGFVNPLPIPQRQYEGSTDLPSVQLTQPVSQAFQRVGDTAYVRALVAAVYLFCYRLASVWQWMNILGAFLLLALFDGDVERRIKTKEFRPHSPAMHGMFAHLFVIGVGLGLFALFWTITIPPIAFGVMLLTLIGFVRVVVSNFHHTAV
jgi:Domain of unknown function (DUF4400)